MLFAEHDVQCGSSDVLPLVRVQGQINAGNNGEMMIGGTVPGVLLERFELLHQVK